MRVNRAQIGKSREKGASLYLLAIGVPIGTLALLIVASMSALGVESVTNELTPGQLEAAELCVDCHEDQGESLVHTAHQIDAALEFSELNCAKCHAGAEIHVEDPEVDNIINPANLPESELVNLCSSCHMPHFELNYLGLGQELDVSLNCLDCHSVHSGEWRVTRENPLEFWKKNYPQMFLEFNRRSNHPVTDGVISCEDCHSPNLKNEAQYGHGISANCYRCHPDKSGPFVYEHEVTISSAVEGDGCVGCHEEHGSVNDRRLLSPNGNMCRNCHTTPPLHRTKHGGLGAKLDCVECHSAVHGSNHNSKLLDPDLGMKLFPDCYQSGCHIIND